jgi:hypothetical protein
MHDFFKLEKVCAWWIRRELKNREKMNQMGLSLKHLQVLQYADEGEDMLNRIVCGDESWVHHYQPKSKCASMQWETSTAPSSRKFKVTPSAGMVMLTMFWDSQGILLANFQERGDSVNSAVCCEVLLKLRDAIRRKHPGQQARAICCIMTVPDPIQPKQPRREFKNYSGNFLNIRLTARTWPLVTSFCLIH